MSCRSNGSSSPSDSNSSPPHTIDMIRDCKWTTNATNVPTIFTSQNVQSVHLQDASEIAHHAFLKFDKLRRKNELCDVEILVGQRIFPVHRVVLAAHSPYFHAMFTRELSECRQQQVRIHEVEENSMETLIEYCYTSNLSLTTSNVQSILSAACLFQITGVQKQCCDYLKKMIDPTNCLEIRSFADFHSCYDLLRFADQYTQDNFNQIKATEEFLRLTKEQLIEIISSNELCVSSEEDVYNGVMQWIQFDPEKRNHMLSQLLRHVRMPLMKPTFLIKSVGTHPLIRKSISCRDLVDEAKNFLLLPQERSEFDSKQITPRTPLCKEERVVFVVGGWCTGDALSSVEAYDSIADRWKVMAKMQKCRCGVGVGILQNLMFAVGGHDGIHYLNTVERYDLHSNIWSMDVAPTSSSRTSVGVAVLDDVLYAVGGQDGISCSNIVEKYDHVQNRWIKVSGLHNRRLGAAVTVSTEGHDRGIYAVGGSDGISPLGSVEFFDPRLGRWQMRSPMSTRRKHLGAAYFNGYIFAVGGRDISSELSSVERYNARMDLWTPSIPMNNRRSGINVAVLDKCLMVIGGFDGTNYLDAVEMYDDSNQEWKSSCPMNQRRLGSGTGVLCYLTNDLSKSLTFNE